MDMSGSRTVPADIETTWRALNDPEVLKACIAGCESVERVSDNIAMIDRGQIVMSGPLDEVKAVHHRLTLRFPEARTQPPALAGVMAWQGEGHEWTAVCTCPTSAPCGTTFRRIWIERTMVAASTRAPVPASLAATPPITTGRSAMQCTISARTSRTIFNA